MERETIRSLKPQHFRAIDIESGSPGEGVLRSLLSAEISIDSAGEWRLTANNHYLHSVSSLGAATDESPNAESAYELAEREFAAGRLDIAPELFHRAYVLGHKRAKQRVSDCYATLLKPMRTLYPTIFLDLDRGESLRALNLLRMASSGEHRHLLGPVLAYCLRGARCPREGILICEELLNEDPLQDDLHGHLFAFLFELEEHESACSAAARHLQFFPDSALAWRNACDGALMLRRHEEALAHLHGYVLCSQSENLAFQKVFETFEELGLCDITLDVLRQLGKAVKRPDPKTLRYYGETLCDLGLAAEASPSFERGLAAAPEDIALLVSYARCLAKQGELASAERLLRSREITTNPRVSLIERVRYVLLRSALSRDLGDIETATMLWLNLGLSLDTLMESFGVHVAGECFYVMSVGARSTDTEPFRDFNPASALLRYPQLREYAPVG